MKNFNDLNPEGNQELSYTEFLSDTHIEDQINRNEDLEIEFLLDLSSDDLY